MAGVMIPVESPRPALPPETSASISAVALPRNYSAGVKGSYFRTRGAQNRSEVHPANHMHTVSHTYIPVVDTWEVSVNLRFLLQQRLQP
jgi:hypothetical protein